MDRRSFIQSAAAPAVAAAIPGSHAFAAATNSQTLGGMQDCAVSVVDEGVEKGLDVFQQDGAVNTLFLATFTYGRGIAGRQIASQPLPDHGKREYDTDTFHGGSYTRIHPEDYRDTVLTDFRAPEFGDYDVLEAVLPSARKRGMKTICWFEDVWRRDVPRVSQAQEVQLDGANSTNLCFNNPNYKNWLVGAVGDYARSYDID